MKFFYRKNADGSFEVGSGQYVQDGYTEYDVLNIPIDLQNHFSNEELIKQVNDAKKYLKDTDWIALKVSDEIAMNGYDAALTVINKYTVELSERKNKRLLINQLESQII